MDERGALVVCLVLSSCGASRDTMGPAFPVTIGPADDPADDDETSGDDGGSSSSTEDDGTTTADVESTGDATTSDGDELPAGHCDPLAANPCPVDEVCIFFQNAYFKCVNDASGPNGGVGEVCEFLNVCDPGLLCTFEMGVACPDGGDSCCVPFCDLSGGVEQCPAGNCVPYFPDGSPFPWLETLGHCDAVQ